MKKTYSTFIFLAMTFAFAIDIVLAEDNIYFCSDKKATGFNSEGKNKNYDYANFKLDNFKIKLDIKKRNLTYVYDYAGEILKETYVCKHDYLKKIWRCNRTFYAFNFNINNGRYVRFAGFGYVVPAEQSLGDSIYIAFGTCVKF